MTFAKALFVAVDKLFDKSQNSNKLLRPMKDEEFVIDTDIVYDKSDAQTCVLDLYRTARTDGSKYPVFFYIHGGGFVAGDKKHRRGLSKWAAKRGFFVVNINYALSPDYIFPTPLKNLVSALNWVGDNAEKYNLDLSNMCVSGDSAGGYYSAMLCCIAANKELQQRLNMSTDLKFRGAILDCGVYDVGAALSRHMPFNLTDKILYDFAGIHIKEFNDYKWKDITAPLDFVTSDFPATFLTYAEKDIFCKGQGPRMIEKLKENGVHVEENHSTHLLDNHCYPLTWTSKAAKHNNDAMDDFMKRFIAKQV